VSLIEPMVPETDAAYCVHRPLAADDRAALIASIGSSVRATLPAAGTAPEVREKTQRRRQQD
jgi:hypothetical protein